VKKACLLPFTLHTSPSTRAGPVNHVDTQFDAARRMAEATFASFASFTRPAGASRLPKRALPKATVTRCESSLRNLPRMRVADSVAFLI
jgi:hypothetical protein